MRALVFKEINSFFNHLIGYLILTVFLLALGLIVWVFPETSVLEYGFADLEAMFVYTPYVFVFLVPAITMRMIAEEKMSGTWELLMTSPLKPSSIVLAKYAAAISVLILALIPTMVYYFSVYYLGSPQGNLDSAGFFGSFIGLILIGAVFGAIGLLGSSLSSNQITAFVVGVFLCFFLYFGLSSLASLSGMRSLSVYLEAFSMSYHFQNLGRGVIDSADLFYFVGWIIFLLMLTILMIRRK
ncbi:gliding motility-associated ABC transporter permease subunit GldF [Echinicola jeungdonensis]|uniref:Gliding motility-associated ABC transporter permease subunit GldF n=1 Tax=Echinicola jeungdonensis TaxID=709343 RepID=A0ABV5J156_9BACT|nr:gliding motility-associated ABC transporter permease subunit GldF [Echinicola jeungdonensis]MDN3668393.1 gliding motility-associated ABC transporter permease subunit GldF [Echinicola jeungdonensis]